MLTIKDLLAGLTTAAFVTIGIGNVANAADVEITMAGSGGVVAEYTKKAYHEQFAKMTGIKVKRVSTEAKRLVQLEAMIKSGNLIWDLMEMSASHYPIAARKGLLEPIDYSIVDPDKKLPDEARKKYGVVYAAWSHMLAVRTDKLPAGKKIKNWADFWNVKEFPGPRSLRARPQDNLEFALLADGVAKKDLYKVLSTPEGVDRAFKKLDEIKPHIVTWWKSGAQSVQLLSDGEVHFGTSYNGRVKKIAESGVPTEIVWEGGGLHFSQVSIPKGSKHPKEALMFARFRTLDPAPMLNYIKEVPYPGFAPGLYDDIDPAVAASLPTSPENFAAQFTGDDEFWADNIDAIQERWNEWLLN